MKVTAFFMVICMSLISVLPRTVQAMQYGKEPKCCVQPGKAAPCKSHRNDKTMGMCLTRLCCNVPGFTTNTIFGIKPAVSAELKSYPLGFTHQGTVDFSFPFWHPPKTVV